jgi:hypothetical protein
MEHALDPLQAKKRINKGLPVAWNYGNALDKINWISFILFYFFSVKNSGIVVLLKSLSNKGDKHIYMYRLLHLEQVTSHVTKLTTI